MASNDIVSIISHYKRNIEKICSPPERALKHEERLLHCIGKLYKLPVKVDHLSQTGIGRTVNSLRKIEGNKGLGDAAKALVAKWKLMVMQEEEEAEREKKEDTGPSEEDVHRIMLIREAEKREENSENDKKSKPKQKIKQSDESTDFSINCSINGPLKDTSEYGEEKSNGKDKKRKSESINGASSSKKSKYMNENYSANLKSNSDDSDNAGNEDYGNDFGSPENVYDSDVILKSKSYSSSSKSSSKSNHKSSNSHHTHESSKSESQKEHKSSSSSSKPTPSKSSSSKHHKSSSSHEKKDSGKSTHNSDAGGIDSQSGASFADALGPMLVKKSPKKKSSSSSVLSPPSSSQHSSNNGVLPAKTKRKEVKEADEQIFPPADLQPLELDLMSTLPVTTPYYKPNPVYNLPSHEATKKRAQAEEDALFNIMSNKNQRTKVYSGVKGGLTYVPSLYESCCRVLQQHIDALEYTGGIPYSLLKPVLDGATPAQLYQFEHFNPYIIEDTDHLWNFHVNKEFRNEKRQEYESWREMYLRCVDEREEKYKAVTANIQKSIIEKSAPVRKAKLAYIDVAKPPRNILKKQLKNGIVKPESSRLLGKNDPEAVRVAPPKQPTTKEPAMLKIKPKVAPLMQKTLKSIKMTRFKR